jgi:hypothetical protein
MNADANSDHWQWVDRLQSVANVERGIESRSDIREQKQEPVALVGGLEPGPPRARLSDTDVVSEEHVWPVHAEGLR